MMESGAAGGRWVEPPWHGPPRWWLPGTVALDRMLLVTDHVAVAVREASCYPTGVRLGVEVAVRRAAWSTGRWADVNEALYGEGHPGRRGRGPQDDDLSFAVVVGGVRTVAGDEVRRSARVEPDRPYLAHVGSSASGGDEEFTRQVRLWLWPLPPPGPLDLVLAWSAFDVPETVTRIDADVFIAAARRARPYWSDQMVGSYG